MGACPWKDEVRSVDIGRERRKQAGEGSVDIGRERRKQAGEGRTRQAGGGRLRQEAQVEGSRAVVDARVIVGELQRRVGRGATIGEPDSQYGIMRRSIPWHHRREATYLIARNERRGHPRVLGRKEGGKCEVARELISGREVGA